MQTGAQVDFTVTSNDILVTEQLKLLDVTNGASNLSKPAARMCPPLRGLLPTQHLSPCNVWGTNSTLCLTEAL